MKREQSEQIERWNNVKLASESHRRRIEAVIYVLNMNNNDKFVVWGERKSMLPSYDFSKRTYMWSLIKWTEREWEAERLSFSRDFIGPYQ